MADRIRAVTRDADVVARLGADQFAVLVEGVCRPQAMTAMARNLLRAFEPPYALGGRETVATLSIGIAGRGEDADSGDELLQCADAAMRAAKADGGGRYRSYEPTMRRTREQQLDIDLRLRHALQGGEFFLVFQPIVDADGERIVAVEALLRWANPERGVVSPADFIPVLEQTGLIVPAGRWVLKEACRRGVAWGQAVRDAPTAVGQRVAAPVCRTRLRRYRHRDPRARPAFRRERLQLEVTEGLLLDPTPESLRKIDALVDAGVRIAVDDFGMGYSSLAYLKRFRLHALKIDRMFVRDIALQRAGCRDRARDRRPRGTASDFTSPPRASRPPSSSTSCAGSAAIRCRGTCSRGRSASRR